MVEYYDSEEVLHQSLVGKLQRTIGEMTEAMEDLANKETHICDVPYEKMFELVASWQIDLNDAVRAVERAKLEGKLDRVLFNPVVKREQ